MAIKNRAQFIAEAKKVHGDKYNYDLADFKFGKAKVVIVCEKHAPDVFLSVLTGHLHSAPGLVAVNNSTLGEELSFRIGNTLFRYSDPFTNQLYMVLRLTFILLLSRRTISR